MTYCNRRAARNPILSQQDDTVTGHTIPTNTIQKPKIPKWLTKFNNIKGTPSLFLVSLSPFPMMSLSWNKHTHTSGEPHTAQWRVYLKSESELSPQPQPWNFGKTHPLAALSSICRSSSSVATCLRCSDPAHCGKQPDQYLVVATAMATTVTKRDEWKWTEVGRWMGSCCRMNPLYEMDKVTHIWVTWTTF